jgi:hypothetical protein
LLGIFDRARRHSGASIGAAYKVIFEIQQSDYRELFRKLSLAGDTAEEVAELLQVSGNQDFEHIFRAESLPAIKELFAPRNLDGAWDEFKKRILDRELTALRYCSNLLSKHFEEAAIPDDQLKEILAEVEALYSDVWTFDLDKDLKKIALENLQNIKNAIHDYKIRGADGLQEALALVVGTAMISGPPAEGSTTNLVEKSSKLIDLLIKALKLARAAKPLLKAALEKFHLLPPGSSSMP